MVTICKASCVSRRYQWCLGWFSLAIQFFFSQFMLLFANPHVFTVVTLVFLSLSSLEFYGWTQIGEHSASLRHGRKSWEEALPGPTSVLHGRPRNAHHAVSKHLQESFGSLQAIHVHARQGRLHGGEWCKPADGSKTSIALYPLWRVNFRNTGVNICSIRAAFYLGRSEDWNQLFVHLNTRPRVISWSYALI